ncbi:MAG: hypothetical protein H5T39_00830 [Methanobacteriales archaeon]|nr:hypothetical protein [Methanobacteriales archaeon]
MNPPTKSGKYISRFELIQEIRILVHTNPRLAIPLQAGVFKAPLTT